LGGKIKTFNITALIYDRNDYKKQTIFMSEMIMALCEFDAKMVFQKQLEQQYHIVKIYSIEEIPQEAA
jgi:hypothetical protein